jgi:DNA-binding response OmpR family regulator
MPTILLICDETGVELTVPRVLATSAIAPVCLSLAEFHPEYLLSEVFDLIIFELFGENKSCLVILKQLENWAATSGIEHPPVIVVTADSSARTEQAVRTAKVNFFFIKPVADAELASAIDQSLHLGAVTK